MNLDIVVALDGGQSATLALAAALNGVVLGSALAGPSNHVDEPGGRERLEMAVTIGIRGALASASRTAEQVACVCLGMTGAPTEAREIAKRLLPTAQVEAHYDVVTALAGASIARSGVVVIAGTGAVAYGRLDDGREARSGGWGYLMGDEGSGYDLGIAALRAACRASDGRGEPTELIWRVPQALEQSDLMGVHRAVYSLAVTRSDLARLAIAVTDSARAGDAVARRLLDHAGHDLADAAIAVIARLERQDSGLTVYPTGGVFQAGDLILTAFRAQIAAQSPASRVVMPAFGPVVGGLLLALRMAGSSLDEACIQRISDSLPAQARIKGQ